MKSKRPHNLIFVLETLEPGLQFEQHLDVVVERGAEAPAVATSRIDVDAGGNVVLVKFGVVVAAVDRHHHVIVETQRYPRTRSGAAHLHDVAEFYLAFLSWFLAEQIVVRAAVSELGIHRDDGVEEYLEVWLGIFHRVGGDG